MTSHVVERALELIGDHLRKKRAAGGDATQALQLARQVKEPQRPATTEGSVFAPQPMEQTPAFPPPRVQPPPAEPPKSYFEVAPGKLWDPELQESWERLHPQAKAAVSHKHVGETLSDWQRTTGIQGEIREGLGGFGGYTNPNYTFHPYDRNELVPATHGLGDFFRQDAMMSAHAEPFEGSFPAGVVRIQMPKNASPEEIHSVYQTLHKAGLAEGHSSDPAAGTMDILAGGSGEEAARIGQEMDKLLEGRYDISAYPTNVSFPAKDVDYGISGSEAGQSSRAPSSPALDSLKAKAQARLRELIDEAHRQGGGHEGEVSFGDTLAPGRYHPDVVSAAVPTLVASYKGPPAEGEARKDIAPSSHSNENRRTIAARLYEQHPAMQGPALEGEVIPPDEAERRFLDFSVKNLLALWDRTPPELRQTSRHWYRAAHALGNAYAEDHGIVPRAAHGIMAVLSPQTPWDKNVTMADRVLDALSSRMDQPWTRGMSDVVRNGGAAGKGLPSIKTTTNVPGVEWADIEGKSLRDVLAEDDGQKKAAMWIRAFDEAHNPSEYRAVSPTGEFMGTMMNKSGSAPDTSSWNSYLPIQKAISIYFDPSLDNINQQIGNNHKVREFYNVITNPNDPNGVVIDTHAVAAGQLLPHGSSAKEVHQNFGTTPTALAKAQLEAKGRPWVEGYDPSKKTGSSGATGDYPLHAEAVRKAAWSRGVHPSEMQSVTWEAIRTLFSNKSEPQQKAVRDVWRRYAVGELNHDQAVDEIIRVAGGFNRPGWSEQAGRGIGKVTTKSYEKPGPIAPDTPRLQRYRSQEEPDEEMARGGKAEKRHPLHGIPGVHIVGHNPVFTGER